MPACNLQLLRLTATARNVSWNASGGHAALAGAFFALSVQARPQLPRARQRKAGTAI